MQLLLGYSLRKSPRHSVIAEAFAKEIYVFSNVRREIIDEAKLP